MIQSLINFEVSKSCLPFKQNLNNFFLFFIPGPFCLLLNPILNNLNNQTLMSFHYTMFHHAQFYQCRKIHEEYPSLWNDWTLTSGSQKCKSLYIIYTFTRKKFKVPLHWNREALNSKQFCLWMTHLLDNAYGTMYQPNCAYFQHLSNYVP